MSQIENQETAFKSPIPIIRQLRNLIFGDRIPDNYTQFTFFLNLFFWGIFTIWTITASMALSFRTIIHDYKKIPIEEIILKRGQVLGFEGNDFLNRLITTYAVSIVLWGIVFIGLVLLWRRNKWFIYFIVGGVLAYVFMLIFYMSYTYFKEDTTFFDKIGLLAMLASSVMYYFLMNKASDDDSFNFFDGDSND